MITIFKTQYGYDWQPTNGRRYQIQLNQIFPTRYHLKLILMKEGESLQFKEFEYDRINKILLVKN